MFPTCYVNADGDHCERLLQVQRSDVTCAHLLLSAYTEHYHFKLFPLLKCVYVFLAPSVFYTPQIEFVLYERTGNSADFFNCKSYM